MATVDGAFETQDMVLATILTMNGYEPSMRLTRRNRVVWTVSPDEYDEGVEELVADYLANTCRVEPRRFQREIREVRQKAYALTGQGNRPAGQPLRSAPSTNA